MSTTDVLASVNSDAELKQALAGLDAVQRRQVSAQFVNNVLVLTDDDRIARAITKALDQSAVEEELEDVYRVLQRAMIDSRTRCGADGDWAEQAAHFVSRAANAVFVAAKEADSADPFWQVVQNCRVARTCSMIANSGEGENPEVAAQYRILNEFLAEK